MYIVFDIGGTNTRLAKSRDGHTLDQVIKFSTPPKFEDGVELITKKITELVPDRQILGIAGGKTGMFSKDGLKYTHSDNNILSNWSTQPLNQSLKTTFNCSAVIKNDAIMAGLGEANHGAGKDYHSVMFITIGTGIGGAWLINKSPASNQFNFEPGHQILNHANRSELEHLASGTFLANKFGDDLEKTPKPELWYSIKDALLVGLYNTYLHWPSEVIVLGGGVTLKIDPPLEELKAQLHKLLSPRLDLPDIKIAELGDNSGLYGALSLLKK